MNDADGTQPNTNFKPLHLHNDCAVQFDFTTHVYDTQDHMVLG